MAQRKPPTKPSKSATKATKPVASRPAAKPPAKCGRDTLKRLDRGSALFLTGEHRYEYRGVTKIA